MEHGILFIITSHNSVFTDYQEPDQQLLKNSWCCWCHIVLWDPFFFLRPAAHFLQSELKKKWDQSRLYLHSTWFPPHHWCLGISNWLRFFSSMNSLQILTMCLPRLLWWSWQRIRVAWGMFYRQETSWWHRELCQRKRSLRFRNKWPCWMPDGRHWGWKVWTDSPGEWKHRSEHFIPQTVLPSLAQAQACRSVRTR